MAQEKIQRSEYSNLGFAIGMSAEASDRGTYYLKVRIPPSINEGELLFQSIDYIENDVLALRAQLLCQFVKTTKFTFCEFNATKKALKKIRLVVSYFHKSSGTYNDYFLSGSDWL